MKLELDEYAHLKSWLHQWEPRCKLIGLMALIVAFALIDNFQLIPFMLAVTGLLYALSRLPLSFWSTRIRYPGLFLFGVVALLPFVSGQTILWNWGVLTLRQEGMMAVVLIVSRFLSIITIGLILFGTTPFLTMVRAMRSLGLPAILADMLLLSYRYLFEIAASLTQMKRSMRLRGFQSQRKSRWFVPNWQDLNRLASLAGTLLVRSYEQAERIYKAMRLRGYGQQSPSMT
ncbi:MAG: cobalt ECF transporter T component CbiQ, partial [Leptolyngbyaceae bacterium]|nr:cobalt ECF transporter T component CbiQ [Leptolyngbyaceae bacterium]